MSEYAAKLTSFHTASLDNNPFTVYVVSVRKENQQWRVFRRYKEWEDLRGRLHQWCGTAPQMPGKMLFGRMRPEVIEARVIGLNQFLQQVLASPQFACPDLVDFLERERNMPPAGLEGMLDPHEVAGDMGGGTDGSAEGARQSQLKQLVEATSAAFIPVSHEPPSLDPSYLAERAGAYAATLRPAKGPAAGSVLTLAPPPTPPPGAPAVEAALQKLLAEPTGASKADAALARSTAEEMEKAVSGIAVQGKHEVLVSVG